MRFSTIQSKNVFSVKIMVLFFAVISFLFFLNLGNRPFANPDEARYVEIAREMNISGDWITPTLNGVRYLEKPPLFYWIETIAIKAFGTDFFGLRLPQVIIALLGVLSLFLFLRISYNTKIAYMSCYILATSVLFFVQSRFINLDLLLSVLLECSLLSYATAIILGKRTKCFLRLFYLFLALACLAKGLVAIVLTGSTILTWLFLSTKTNKEKIDIIKTSLDIPGILIFSIIAVPWHVLCFQRNSDFFDFYFIHEHFHRYLSDSHNRFQPWYFFIAIIPLGIMPWTGFLLGKCKLFKQCIHDDVFKFLCVWVSVITIFFSFSQSKLIPYILPVFFPLSAIIGIFLASNFTDKRYVNISIILNVVIFIAIICYVYFYTNIPQISAFLYLISGLILFIIIAQIVLSFHQMKTKNLIFIYSVFAGYLSIISTKIIPFVQEASYTKASIYSTAQNIKYNLNDKVRVYCYKEYLQDLPIYLNCKVGVIGFSGELAFGINTTAEKERFLSEDSFMELFKKSSDRIFVCMRRKRFDSFLKKCDSEYRILEVTPNFVVLVNR